MDKLKDFYAVTQKRRSYYNLNKESLLSKEAIEKIIEHAVLYTPSAFNSQSTRIVLLLNTHHDWLWETLKVIMEKKLTAEQFATTESKINAFLGAFGTILFFEEEVIVKALQKQFPTYEQNFPIWSQQANAMHQYVIWSALEAEGLGASLQHYNELIENKVKEKLELPLSWKMIAQMPFGNPSKEPDEKEAQPLTERIKIFA